MRKFNNYEDRFIEALDKKLDNPVTVTDRQKLEEEEFYKELDKYYHLQDLKENKKLKTLVCTF